MEYINIFKYYRPQQKVLQKILEKFFITKKFTQCETSRILKIDVFKILDNKNIGKLFSKYELLSLDQENSSSDSSQILPPSSSLSNFTLAN